MTTTLEFAPLTDEEYSDLLHAIREFHRLRPTFRFGQMICAMAALAGRDEPGGIYDLEDLELLTALRQQIQHDENLEPLDVADKRNSEPPAQIPV